MADRYSWCNCDPDKSQHGLSPHATWCPHFRRAPVPDPSVLMPGATITILPVDQNQAVFHEFEAEMQRQIRSAFGVAP